MKGHATLTIGTLETGEVTENCSRGGKNGICPAKLKSNQIQKLTKLVYLVMMKYKADMAGQLRNITQVSCITTM